VKPFWPFRHFGLKVLSLLIALLLWMAVAGEETVERGLRVPLELQQLPPNLELTGEVPTTVDVRLRGGSGALSRVGAGDVVAVLDLRSARPGRRVFSLTQDQVRVPFGVDVVQISPSAVAVVFEESSSRQVQVVPAIDGRPAPGFVVESTSADPATVEVVGPESAVERVTEATTEPVSIDNATTNVTDTVIVGFLDSSLRLRTPKPARITVEVIAGAVERTLAHVPVRLHAVPSGLAATPTPPRVDVVLSGRGQAVNKADAAAIVPWVDLTGLGPGEYVLNVHVDLPSDAWVARVIPDTVQVRVGLIE